MERTLIIGASGKVGKQLTQNMLNGGHVVVALVRDKEKLSDVRGSTLSIVETDLTQNFEHAFKDCSNVIFVAGSGPDTGADKTLLIDLWSACRAVDYAIKHDVKHFVMVSSIGADSPLDGPEEMQPYLVAKHMADEHLMRSGLHYTILRPGALTNDSAKGKYTTNMPDNQDDARITRSDLASALVYINNANRSDSTVTLLFNGNKGLSQALDY